MTVLTRFILRTVFLHIPTIMPYYNGGNLINTGRKFQSLPQGPGRKMYPDRTRPF
jgi:hypothetical protein